MALLTDGILTPGQLRNAEWGAMNDGVVSEDELIETAAGALVSVVCEIADGGRVAALAGPGNNGADAWAAARFLAEKGYSVDVWELPTGKYSAQRGKTIGSGLPVGVYYIDENISLAGYDIVLDGLFGIGINRELRPEIASVVRKINETRRENIRQRIVSVDVPSGIDAGVGIVHGEAVKADVTVTFSTMKPGLILYPGRKYAGEVRLADAGVPAAYLPKSEYRRIKSVPVLPERDPAGHKGTFGRILIVAGSETGPGAALLATEACYRSGAGLCKLVTPSSILPEVLHTVPEAVFCGRERFFENPAKEMSGMSVILIGPGLGTDGEAARLLDSVLAVASEWNNTEANGHAIVLDADALNIISSRLTDTDPAERIRSLNRLLPKRCILTPHMAELGRLLGISASEIAERRLEFASMWNEESDLVLVMKDACTLVIGDGVIRFNETGNDGMGTAGSGDVLAGITAAMSMEYIHGSMSLAECAAAAVALHGTAGDLAAEDIGRRSLKAGDLVRYLPRSFGAPCAVEERE